MILSNSDDRHFLRGRHYPIKILDITLWLAKPSGESARIISWCYPWVFNWHTFMKMIFLMNQTSN